MIKVTYYYSACVAITTPDVSILCDPWFTDGIYDGAWYQYPKIKNPIELIGKHDIIYVSHIHPDHYDPRFIKEYLKVYPDTIVLIAEGVFLDKKMAADGIKYKTLENLIEDGSRLGKRHGSTHYAPGKNDIVAFRGKSDGSNFIGIVNNSTESISDIDTALYVGYYNPGTYGESEDDDLHWHGVVNMNDNQFNQEQIDTLIHFNGGQSPDIALLGYTGAGPYPQTYYRDHEMLEVKAEEKKQEFFGRYMMMANELDAKVNIPFAGQYVLGGKLSHMNKWRGVADATEMLWFDDKAVVLQEGASIDTERLKPTKARIAPYNTKEMYAYASNITEPMDYMKDFGVLKVGIVPWGRLLYQAYKNASKKSECDEHYFIIIKTPIGLAHMAVNGNSFYVEEGVDLIEDYPYSLIEIDYRYLFGLITGVYHWNNAEVGSQYMTTRVPDEFNRSVQRFLNFFVV